ncbi:hypothetical protein P167DRAFT_541438 [Morchella conica CCBAS932]|uniref:Ima1 N-terminal domain-containing protein n=1 Tax=Morchella conica CCBAS932 TaxID=1392247 RepID=A0A3N4L9R9_9PEZI|nr:hypothetical protein P167DRAFT_541438 [Morchella conica CCBAS932]
MSFLGRIRRKKLVCFYCQQLVFVDSLPEGGVYSYPSGRTRQFTCPECCADNHLDENGEILDYVPDSPPKPAPIYARRRTSPRANIHSFSSTTRSSTPDSPAATSPTTATATATTDEKPFCRTCVNNQRVVTDAIAAYPLPPEDHPDYDEVVSVQFPKYRATLEERWPQVCARCAPRVNERIRTSNYQVKVASLGQMLARTSGYEAAKKGGEEKGGGKKRLETAVWVARGAVWCYFHVLMIVWHGAALVQPAVAMEMETEVASWGSCVLRSAVAGEVDVHCYGVAAQQARWVPWSLVGFFWIYRERGLQRQPHKKLVGSREYFRLEMAIYVFRMLCWYFVTPGGVPLTEEAFTMVHLGLFFLSFLSTLFSITCLKLEDPPSISLREPQPVPGTPSPPESPPPQMISALPRHPMSPTTPMRPGTANPPPSTGGSTFYSPVKRVRAASPTPLPRRTIQESPDAMDWNPTTANETKWEIPSHRLPPPPQPSFTLPPSSAQLQRQNQYNNNNRSPSPSPFTGTLPPAPRAPAQRIVSSLMQQPLRPTPPAQISREQFFAHRLNPGQAAVPAGREFEKVAAPGYRLGSPRYAPMAPQRFFVADEATGLELWVWGWGRGGSGGAVIIDPDLYPHHCRWVVDWLSVHFGSDTGLRPPGAGLMVNSAGCPEDAVLLGWAFCAVGRSG